MPNIKKKYPCQWFLKDKESKLFSIRSSFLLIGSQALAGSATAAVSARWAHPRPLLCPGCGFPGNCLLKGIALYPQQRSPLSKDSNPYLLRDFFISVGYRGKKDKDQENEKQVHRGDVEIAEIKHNFLFAGKRRQTKSFQPPAAQKEPLNVTIILLFH